MVFPLPSICCHNNLNYAVPNEVKHRGFHQYNSDSAFLNIKYRRSAWYKIKKGYPILDSLINLRPH